MKKLIRDNILEIKPYEPGKSIEVLSRELKIDEKIIKLASNENPLGPSPFAIRAMQKSLGEGHFYPDNSCYDLREKLAEHLSRGEQSFSPTNLMVGNGSTQLIQFIAITFLNPGENVVMSKPSFIMAKLATQVMNCNLIEVPLKDYRHNLDAILEAVNSHTKIVYLDNPINPIGPMITHEEVSNFMRRLPEDIVVMFDEAYCEYIDRDDYPDTLKLVKDGRNVIILRTFSKVYGLAGFRVGYCIAKEDFIDALSRAIYPFSVNRLAQVGAAAALEDKEHVEHTKKLTQAGKKFLYENFEKMGVFYIPSETNFITIDLKRDAKMICDELQKEGVIVRRLTMYDEPMLLRVTIGTPEQNKKFIDAFKRVYYGSGLRDSQNGR